MHCVCQCLVYHTKLHVFYANIMRIISLFYVHLWLLNQCVLWNVLFLVSLKLIDVARCITGFSWFQFHPKCSLSFILCLLFRIYISFILWNKSQHITIIWMCAGFSCNVPFFVLHTWKWSGEESSSSNKKQLQQMEKNRKQIPYLV